MHTEELFAPIADDHVPTPQGTHDVAPNCALYVPTPQGAQSLKPVDPDELIKVPIGHDKQRDAPGDGEYDPGTHA